MNKRLLNCLETLKELQEPYKIEEANSGLYLPLPLELLENDIYANNLSLEARVLYAYLIDRKKYSAKNNWVNENGELYIIFTRKEAAKKLHISKPTTIKAFEELNKIGLIEEVKCGYMKANKIYIRKITHQSMEELEKLAKEKIGSKSFTCDMQNLHDCRSKTFTNIGKTSLPNLINRSNNKKNNISTDCDNPNNSSSYQAISSRSDSVLDDNTNILNNTTNNNNLSLGENEKVSNSDKDTILKLSTNSEDNTNLFGKSPNSFPNTNNSIDPITCGSGSLAPENECQTNNSFDISDVNVDINGNRRINYNTDPFQKPVMLSDGEYNNLVKNYSEIVVLKAIEKLANEKTEKDIDYNSDYSKIKDWGIARARKDLIEENREKEQRKYLENQKTINNYLKEKINTGKATEALKVKKEKNKNAKKYVKQEQEIKNLTPEEMKEQEEFNKIWNEYPNQIGKPKAFLEYQEWAKGKNINGKIVSLQNDDILGAIKNYKYKIITGEVDSNYVLGGERFFKGDGLIPNYKEWTSLDSDHQQKIEIGLKLGHEPTFDDLMKYFK